VLERIREVSPVVDKLILCARHYRSTRAQTSEGFEDNLALCYLNRYVLGHGLAGPREPCQLRVVRAGHHVQEFLR
jgi:hypothetical protein